MQGPYPKPPMKGVSTPAPSSVYKPQGASPPRVEVSGTPMQKQGGEVRSMAIREARIKRMGRSDIHKA